MSVDIVQEAVLVPFWVHSTGNPQEALRANPRRDPQEGAENLSPETSKGRVPFREAAFFMRSSREKFRLLSLPPDSRSEC